MIRCFFLLLIFSLLPIFAQQNEIVSDVIIQGLMTVSEESIKPKLETQAGSLFSSKTLKNDIQRLHQLGVFSNVEVRLQQTSKGIQITFLVTENQLLGQIILHGNREMSNDEILEKLRITKERYLASHTLSLDMHHLEDEYHKEGFIFVQIRTEKIPRGGWIDLHIYIDEGPEVTIRRISFFGNKTFSKSDLLDLIKTQETAFLSAQYYDADIFQEDLLALRNYYRSEGFLDVRLHLRDITYSADRTEMDINIVLEEGPQYTVEKITFQGNRLFTEKEFEYRTTLKPGSAFKQNELVADKAQVERLYGENGFLNIKVLPMVSIADIHKTTVNIAYKIEEGDKTYIRKIDIKGNTLTKDDVIRRELVVQPGEQFNLGKMENSQMRLQRLHYFDSLKMDFMDTDSPNWKDLLISIEEGEAGTGNFRFAAGITSDQGAIGEISFTKRNFDIANLPKSWSEFFSGDSFTGAGQSLDIYLQVGKDLFRFRIGFVEPYLFGYDWSLGTEIYSTLRGYESFVEDRMGGQISLGKRLTQDFDAKLIYRFENVGIGDVDEEAPRDVFAVKGDSLISSLTLDFTLDTRDDYILPTRGYIMGVAWEVAGSFLGSDYDFSKVILRMAWFQTVYTNDSGNKHVFSLGMRIGFASPFGSSSQVPIFERYFAGGSGSTSSIRGFTYRTVSPREHYPGRDDDPIGGNFMFIGTAEYNLPIYQDVLRMVLFTDVGNVVPEVDSTIFDSIRASVGIGFRIKIPFFGPRPFAFDFGFPIRKEDDDDTRVFSFSFGKQF